MNDAVNAYLVDGKLPARQHPDVVEDGPTDFPAGPADVRLADCPTLAEAGEVFEG
ncbi:hypothetical protein [Spirillospora sp. CA-294931]|uniref:hypothetical protein n=1 Tax=Spirillospora sp. CA-294931 TaxID=3240042 RepID=UPI003D8BE6FD